MTEAVIFDVGGVLASSWDGLAGHIARQLGVDHETERQIFDYYDLSFGVGKISEAEFWEQVASRFNTRLVTPEENLFGKTWQEKLQINKELLDYARELGKTSLKLAILSDTNIVHAQILKNTGVYEPFPYLFLSYETGIRKPDPAIFKLVLSRLDTKPDQAVFVDDSPVNIQAASELGIQTVLATDPSQIISDVNLKLG